MKPLRKTAIVAGIFYLLTFVSIPMLNLYAAVRALDHGASAGRPVLLDVSVWTRSASSRKRLIAASSRDFNRQEPE